MRIIFVFLSVFYKQNIIGFLSGTGIVVDFKNGSASGTLVTEGNVNGKGFNYEGKPCEVSEW